MGLSRRSFTGRAIAALGGVAAIATAGLPMVQDAVQDAEPDIQQASLLAIRINGTAHTIPLANFAGLSDEWRDFLTAAVQDGRDVAVQFENGKSIFTIF